MKNNNNNVYTYACKIYVCMSKDTYYREKADVLRGDPWRKREREKKKEKKKKKKKKKKKETLWS